MGALEKNTALGGTDGPMGVERASAINPQAARSGSQSGELPMITYFLSWHVWYMGYLMFLPSNIERDMMYIYNIFMLGYHSKMLFLLNSSYILFGNLLKKRVCMSLRGISMAQVSFTAYISSPS